jgi:hypothetical protein
METTHAEHQDRRIDLIEKRIDQLQAAIDSQNNGT